MIAWLAGHGWRIRRAADTRAREHGTDIVAERAGRTLHVEVKGWPSDRYVDPARQHEVKRTPATLQARASFADAVMQVLRLRTKHPGDDVAVAVPDTLTYRSLTTSISSGLAMARITLLLVDESGEVQVVGGEGVGV